MRGYPLGIPSFIWYTGRDSNPQPSEPESDALSIEPPVHLPYGLVIITGFPSFVKRCFLKFLRLFSRFLGKKVVFRESVCYNLKKQAYLCMCQHLKEAHYG